MKIVVTNEIILEGALSFEAEFVPATEHEHTLCAEILAGNVCVSHLQIEKAGDVMAARFALTIAEPQEETEPEPEQQEEQAQAAEE